MKRNLLLITLLCLSFGLKAQYWSQQNTNMVGTTIGVDQVSIVDSVTVWVDGFNGSGVGGYIHALSRTHDGGTTWVPGTYSGFGATVHSAVLCGVTNSKGFCVGYDTVAQSASYWKTIDGGATWTTVTGVLNSSSSFADGVKFWNSHQGFCYGDPVSSYFEIYTTSDSGATWTAVPTTNIPVASSTTEYGYNGFDCAAIVPGGIGFFLSNMGRVFKTTDYGATWSLTATAPYTTVPNSGKIYASSANYIITSSLTDVTNDVWSWKYTTDGGSTWATFTPASGNFYTYQMCYVPGTANLFVAASPYSSLMGVGYSNDGGMNWTDFTDATYLQPAGSNIQCLGVGFFNQKLGWVGNYDQATTINSILKYSNPGGIVGLQSYSLNGNDLNIYPNPGNGKVQIAVNGPSNQDVTIRVYDLTGNLIFERILNANGVSSTSYDFSNLSKGMYIVNASSANDQINSKLVIN